MKINKIFRTAIINEIKFVLKKMKESTSFEKKLFYFSAIPAELLRVFNLEYDQDILYIHHVINHTHIMFQQRIINIKAGDTTVVIDDRQIDRLESLINDVINVIEQNKKFYNVLKAFIELAYSTSCNGYYLREKGLLKI